MISFFGLIKRYFGYLFLSKRKKDYQFIAKELKVTPFRVYCLAHGEKAISRNDFAILNKLKDIGIISSYRLT